MPGRPHTLWSRLVLLLERAWVKTGHKPGASSRSEGPCAPCAHCSLHRALARRELASSAPDKNQLLKGTRGRSGAASEGETAATAHLAELRFWARLCTHSAPRGPEPRLCSSTADARRSQQLSESHANLPLLITQEQERCPKPNR